MLDALRGFADWVPLGLPAFLFVITVVVFFHELGHFSVARYFGVKVETFSIGFGPEVVGWTDKKGTRWKLSWIPLGGYVKFFGDADAASRPDTEGVKAMDPAERAVTLPAKPVFQRMAISAAGPFANFILAIVIFTALFASYGRIVIPPVVGEVIPGSAAQAAGIKPGDLIKAINGQPVYDFQQLPEIIGVSAGEDLSITLMRDGQSLILHATPRITRLRDALGDLNKTPALGIRISQKVTPVHVALNPIQAFGAACGQTWDIITGSLSGLKQMVTGRTDSSQLMGTLGMARASKKGCGAGSSGAYQSGSCNFCKPRLGKPISHSGARRGPSSVLWMRSSLGPPLGGTGPGGRISVWAGVGSGTGDLFSLERLGSSPESFLNLVVTRAWRGS